ncbi:MAG TPA: C39 family peptidase [Thauera sp.]|uniref:C39 family peptidase n=1 Tax=Thauera sp. TaxID=1905334 RepID=UPI002C152CC0|nr:C39 family peptidase [Thauera sp.]HRP23099.1 C39 family peptidase [Thauera sp.]HRP66523.1 C39 family peptidase [Thauera sp.]
MTKQRMAALGRRVMGLCVTLFAIGLMPSPAQAERLNIITPTAGGAAVPTVSMKGLRFSATLRQQYDFSCGSAAVATLLTHHYGWKVDEAAVFQAMFEHGDQAKIRQEGFSMLDMKRYLDNRGFTANGVEASLDQLAEVKVPAIALINENGYAHFVVIKGVRGKDVLLGDPAMGTRVMARKDFERYWINSILLVVTNRIEVAKFNRDEDWRVRPGAPLQAQRDNAVAAMHSLTRRSMVDF